MRTSEAFILGTITGEIQGSVRGKAREVRAKAAEGIRAAETQTGKVLDRGGNSLRRVRRVLAGYQGAR